MQKLIFPINDAMLTAGYKNAAYRSKFGFSHYGHDYISVAGDRSVRAGGAGRVLGAGPDSTLGNVLIVLYPDAANSRTGKSADLILRYYHLASIAVKTDDAVAPGALLGLYGNTGRYSAGPHLHVEADYDTTFFAYSATVGKSGTLIKAGYDKSMTSPARVLYVKESAPEKQSLTVSKATFGGALFTLADDLSAVL